MIGAMTMKSDLEIAREAHLDPIEKVAARAGIEERCIEPYGRDVAKVDLEVIKQNRDRPRGKYVVVTAITPTPLGEGKTTTAVGLAQGLEKIGKRSVLALRQPSMGPTFGIKGGAAGAGYSQVLPMEKLNLHLTGDFHAIGAAHNLLAAMIDNHLHHGNELDIEPHSISWRRVVDINDRALRNTIVGLGSRIDGIPRQSGFDITAASEVGVILALATSLSDLRARLGRIVIGYNRSKEPVTAEDLHAAGSMAVILKDAIKPNLLQTTENSPVLVHAGPFGNIATGNSSVIADRVGIGCGDYLLTEAGFGADMGAERFFNIKCRLGGMRPDAAVLVVTVRALKTHAGRYKVVPGKPLPPAMLEDNPDDVLAGAANLRKHIEIVRDFGVSPVVALNVFPSDHPDEIDAVRRWQRWPVLTSPPRPMSSTVATAPSIWLVRSLRRATRTPTSATPTISRTPWSTSSPRCPPRSTELTGSTSLRPRPRSSPTSRISATGTSRSSSPRPTCPCPTTPPSKGPRPDGVCLSAR